MLPHLILFCLVEIISFLLRLLSLSFSPLIVTSDLNLFNEIAASGDNSLDPGRVPLECLRHGVPAEGPHHLLDLQDQVLGFIVMLCLDL